MNFLGIILASIFGYLLGSVSFSIIVVQWRKGFDIRTTGSGNAGATNTTRVLGKFWGFIVAFLDGCKVIVTALFAVGLSAINLPLFSETSYFIPAFFVLIGHCWPIWYKFKGGKAVSTFLGLLFISNIFYFIFFMILWFSFAAYTRKVSIASIIAGLSTGLFFIWLPWVSGINEFSYMWNSYDSWSLVWNGPDGEFMRFAWINYLHVPTSELTGYYFADSLLEINLIIMISLIILAYRHFPNIVRIKKRIEPQTFPKMTPEQKAEYRRYIHEPKKKKQKR